MPRLLSPDDACISVDVPSGRRYSGRSIEVSDPGDLKILRAGGYTVADTAGTPVKRGGYECTACSFQSYFKLCSRCGAECERPDIVA